MYEPEEVAVIRKVERILDRHVDASGEEYDEEGQAISALLDLCRATERSYDTLKRCFDDVVGQRDALLGTPRARSRNGGADLPG